MPIAAHFSGVVVDTKEFLQLVVPAEGHICIAEHITFDDGKKAFVHYAPGSHDKAASLAKWLDTQRSNPVYFALATYQQTHQNKNDKTRIKRTQKNVALLKSIWLDIDFKDCPAEELVPKLGTFIHKTGIPKPTLMVKSGGGLHVYWCLKESIIPERWVPLAEGLKQLCKDHDLPADHVCTSDQARVLRPVGTHNRKYDPAKEVVVASGSMECYEYNDLLSVFPKIDKAALPAHLRGKQVDTSEYSATGFTPREVDGRKVISDCAVLRHTLKTRGAECSEPEWRDTLLVLRFLGEVGAKLVHPMSDGHIDYDPDATAQKWQERLNADVTGPPLCTTLEQYGHTAKCQACPIYQSKKQKTPLALGYVTEEPQSAPSAPAAPNTPKGMLVTPVHDFPNGWRAMQGNLGIERKTVDKETGEWVWEKVLNRTWRLSQAQKSANTDDYTYIVEAKTVTGKKITIEIQGADLWGSTRTWETLSSRGAPLTTNEQKYWKDLMATWLQKLQEENAVLDTSDQLGWIERTDDNDERGIVGFASGGKAFFKDGTIKESVVTANHKHKGIANYYRPVGKRERWHEVFEFFNKQGYNHIMVMLAASFAGPLMKFTGQSGSILSIVSTGSGHGKSLSLESALAVWGHPKQGGVTLTDTAVATKNKVAYQQNLTVFWDEVRGTEKTMQNFAETAFQITQGKDRERADRSARTIVAQTWHTLLACTSNESVFDLMADGGHGSDAGVYRVFEVQIPEDQKPERDARIATMVSDLQSNYGGVGEQYGQYLAQHSSQARKLVQKRLHKLEDHFNAEPAERFWIATVAILLAAAELANKSGAADFDVGKLAEYLITCYKRLRLRVTGSKSATDPKELLNLYMMQHMGERLVVDKLKVGRGGTYEPQIIGNPANIRKVVYQVGKEQNKLRVVKQDFVRWLWKTRQLRLSGELEARFIRDTGMKPHKAILGAGTQFAMSRAVCLDFDIDVEDLSDDE